jgi:hypothetical protein
MPWSIIEQHRSLMADNFRFIQHNNTQGESSTLLFFERSHKTILYQSGYLQLLDAFAFVGGIFSSVLALFAFMIPLNKMIYEFQFARLLFEHEYSDDNNDENKD